MENVSVKGVEVPAPGLGTWQLKGRECVEAVEEALNIGYRHIDTAQVYENEDRVGSGMRRSDVDREEIFLTTKVWRDRLGTDKLKGSVEASLNRLNTEYVDLLLIHWPFPGLELQPALEKMEELVEENRARHIGVSNFTAKQMERAGELSNVPIFTNQVEYHPFLSQREVLQKCREMDAMLTSYSPLARGEVVRNELLEEIGKRYGKSAAQVALRWNLQQEPVCPIPKASSEEHLKQNFDIHDFELSGEEMGRIHELASNDRKVDPGFAPEWD